MNYAKVGGGQPGSLSRRMAGWGRASANGNPKESSVQEYLESEVIAAGGGFERIKYAGKRGCADDMVFFKFNRIFLVECKRPKGGKISIHQHADATKLLNFGINKVYIRTKYEVDAWIRQVVP
jgi:hypothetical protein